MAPILSILKLVEQGITLLKERELRRQRFFTEIIRPIHERFETMRKNHLETFTYVQTALAGPDCDLQALRKYVSRRTQAEVSDWSMFSALRELGEGSRAPLGDEFSNYCDTLESCLSNIGEVQVTSITFYTDLSYELRSLVRDVHIKPPSKSVEHLDTLIDAFNNYCNLVETSYFKVRAVCMV